MKPIGAVLFDLDGTLIDTAPDLIHCLNLILIKLGEPTVTTKQIKPYISGGFESILKAGLDRDIEINELEEYRLMYLKLYRENLSSQSALFEGMDRLLQAIEQKGLCWGIVTNKPGFLTDPLMRQMNLAHRCCAIISADTTIQKKPHPMPMLEACKRCKVFAESCIYIGDDLRDIEAGNAAGMRTLAASWGYHSPAHAIYEWPADAVVHHPSQIFDWIEKAGKLSSIV